MTTLVLYGVTGDLARRKLLPALLSIFAEKGDLDVLTVGRRPMDRAEFVAYVQKSLAESDETKQVPQEVLAKFLEKVHYLHGDLTSDELHAEMATKITANAVFYLSLPPEMFAKVSAAIGRAGLSDEAAGYRRLVIEKPFGSDLASAEALQNSLNVHWEEDQIFRIDHYLGKRGVQNLAALCTQNAPLAASLNREHVDNVQITFSESLGLEGRAGYYDESGAVRDMLQNHLLQVLATLTMKPDGQGKKAARTAKKAVFAAMRPLRQEDVVLGQYSSYLHDFRESDSDGESEAPPTFVAARVFIENDVWAGVPFYLRTGKRMSERLGEVIVNFKSVQGRPPARLRVEIQPEEKICLQLNAAGEDGPRLLDLSACSAKGGDSPYARMILSVLDGNASLFPHVEEVMQAWRVVESALVGGWPLHIYPDGQNGPVQAEELLVQRGHSWLHEDKS